MATMNPLAMEAMALALAMPTMEEEPALSTALAAKEDAGAMVETAMVVAGQLHVTAATSMVVVATATMVAPPQTMGGELLRPQQKYVYLIIMFSQAFQTSQKNTIRAQ